MDKKILVSTQLIKKEAEKRGIKVKMLYPGKVMALSFMGHTEYTFFQFIFGTSSVACSICNSKDVTRSFLKLSGLSIASGKLFQSKEVGQAVNFSEEIGFPVVLKPTNGIHGEGVFADITNRFELLKAIKKIKLLNLNQFLIEKKFIGREYRIFATKEKTVAITYKIPANVVGDGISNIGELIKIKNSDTRRAPDLKLTSIRRPLLQIKIDEFVKRKLKTQRFTLKSVPKDGQVVQLRDNANISAGGDSIDCTDIAHKSIKEIGVKTIQAIPGLMYGGIDIITTDIKAKQTKDSYVIVEINESPGLRLHHFPYQGKPRDVAKEIIDLAFPETKEY